MERFYICYTCKATKTVIKAKNQHFIFPESLPCGWRGCPSLAVPFIKEKNKTCTFCYTTESSRWWKCCPKHTTEQGPDVVCENCVRERHPEYST